MLNKTKWGGHKFPITRREWYNFENDQSSESYPLQFEDSIDAAHNENKEIADEVQAASSDFDISDVPDGLLQSPGHDVSVDSNCNEPQRNYYREDHPDVGITRAPRHQHSPFKGNHHMKDSTQNHHTNERHRHTDQKQRKPDHAIPARRPRRGLLDTSTRSTTKILSTDKIRVPPPVPLPGPRLALPNRIELNDAVLAKKDHIDYIPQSITFSFIDICIYLFSIGSYLADVGTDIWVAYLYYTQSHTAWFALTLVFILVPCITTTSFSLAWYMQDHRHNKTNPEHKREDISQFRWVSRSIFLFLQIGPVIRYIECLIYGVRSKKERDWYHLLILEDTDSTLLRLIECFMEAAPQLVLQLYIMTTFGMQGGWILIAGQIASCITSLASVSWALTAYHKSLRFSLPDKANMTKQAMCVQFLWRFFTVGARVIALAMFASEYKYWVSVVVGCHWLVMFIWILIQHTHFCHTKVQELFFDMVIAVIYIFCFFNLLEGHTRLRYLFYCTLTYAENTALMITWYAAVGTLSKWYIIPAMTTVLGGYFIGIMLQVIYYMCCHPNNLTQGFEDRKIKVCHPWKELYLCQEPVVETETENIIVGNSKNKEMHVVSRNGNHSVFV